MSIENDDSLWPNHNISPHALPCPTTALQWQPPMSVVSLKPAQGIPTLDMERKLYKNLCWASQIIYGVGCISWFFLRLLRNDWYLEYCFALLAGLSPGTSGIWINTWSEGMVGTWLNAELDFAKQPILRRQSRVHFWSFISGLALSPDCWLNPNKWAEVQSLFMAVGKTWKFKSLPRYLMELLKFDISALKLERMMETVSSCCSVAYFGLDGFPRFRVS